ncbi:hypothetical protein D3C76_1622960 [compost metagenome]
MCFNMRLSGLGALWFVGNLYQIVHRGIGNQPELSPFNDRSIQLEAFHPKSHIAAV